MTQVFQILGALLILAPFGCQQLGSLRPESPAYLWPNLLGSGMLASTAVSGSQWGFVLLEGCWAAVTVRGLVSARARARPPSE
jgi:hypothetical protein